MLRNALRVFLSLMLFAVAAAFPQTSTNNPSSPAATKPAAQAASMARGSDNSPAAAPKSSSTGLNVPLNKAVVTIHGVCETSAAKKADKPAASSDPCVTVVTRRQMEAVIDVVQATGRSVLAPQRRDIAVGYIDLLAGATAAEKAGVAKDPRFAEVLKLARMKALSDMYRVRLQEEAQKISPEEIRSYYKSNLANFEELHLVHLSVPKYNTANLKDADFAARAKKLADEAHDRAVKGDDFEKIEKETLEALAVKSPPPTKMAPIHRGVYAKDQEDMLFALKPGEVSKVIEQTSVFIVFKLESREMPTLDQVKDEIRAKLSREKLERLTNAVGAQVRAEYNDDYFGPVNKNAGRPMIEVPIPASLMI